MKKPTKAIPQDRLIALEGCINFRDFGNYTTTDDKKIKKKHLFRSSQLSKLSQKDTLILHNDLNITAILDLRTHKERNSTPSAPNFLEPILDSHISFGLDPTRISGTGIKDYDYIKMLHYSKKAIKDALLWVFENSKKPFVIHCMGGKDRTGVLVALLLKSLHVDHNTILEDYLHSRAVIYTFIDQLCQKQKKPFEEIMKPSYDVNEMALKHVLDELDTIMDPKDPFSWLGIKKEVFLSFRKNVLI